MHIPEHFPAFCSKKLFAPVFGILFFTSLFPFSGLEAQSCDHTTIMAKYWQYRERFYDHFIVTDRDELLGCVHDGIGYTAASSTSDCDFSSEGFSLPATSINIDQNGSGALGGRLQLPEDDDDYPNLLADHDCVGDWSWAGVTPHKYNWLDMGSETLTQLGWYLTTLATEYELLGRSHQYEEQQRTLEDIFLALQAIRRLDMQAQCMIKKMYDDRKTNGDVVCDDPYTNVPGHGHWDNYSVEEDCEFEPDLSGYSGFMIRCDADQNLEGLLDDESEEMYNIDAVGGAYTTSENEIGLCDQVDQFCYMVRTQWFLSQDQMINLLYGLSFVKRFIPPSATVTTCEGETFNVLEMAQNSANAIIRNPALHWDQITLPGAGCTDNAVSLNIDEGGNCFATMHGFNLVYSYMNDDDDYFIDVKHALAFEGMANIHSNSNSAFYYKLSAMGRELSGISNYNQNKFTDAVKHYNKEILLLGNDLLFPGGESMADKVGGAEYFLEQLCNAPCGGPCIKNSNYDDLDADPQFDYPDYDCPNVPDWTGARWDGVGAPLSGNRIFNGLDFMSLFNMYCLEYSLNDFSYVNPQNPENQNIYSGFTVPDIKGDKIDGPSQLCIGQSGDYTILHTYQNSLISDIVWRSSTNISVSPQGAEQTSATMNALQNGSFIAVDFVENRQIPQYYGGLPYESQFIHDDENEGHYIVVNIDYPSFTDHCSFTLQKPLENNLFEFKISTNLRFCNGHYYLDAIGPDIPGASFYWTIQDNAHNQTHYLSGQEVHLDLDFGQTPPHYGYGTILLVVITPCGVKTYNKTIVHGSCGWGLENGENPLLLFPNPVDQELNVVLSDENLNMPNEGALLRIAHANSGVQVRQEQIYSKATTVNIGELSEGAYNLQVQLGNGLPFNGQFVIQRQ